MTALDPALAIEYVRELSADVHGGVVLAADGRRLAGEPALVDLAHELVRFDRGAVSSVSDGAIETSVRERGEGTVCSARSTAHAIVVVCGPFAIGAVVLADLRAVLHALAG